MRLRRTNHSNHRRRESAYSLAEALVALGVIGVMVISLFAGFSSGFALVRLSREDVRATQILMQKVEAIRLCTWSQLSSFPTTFKEKFDPTAVTNQPTDMVFNGEVLITPPDAIPNTSSYKTNMRLVTVSVYWTNFNNRLPVVHTNRVQTQVARYGMQNYEWGAGK